MPRPTQPTVDESASAARILAEHYQKTNELTYTLRSQRDKSFIFLLIALAVATLFNFDVNSSSSLLIAAVVKFLEIKDSTLSQSLSASPLLELIQTLLLAAVFYLMGNLYQRTASVLRNYQYLGRMELEIRERLGIKPSEVSFSREGSYYWQARKEEGNRRHGKLLTGLNRLRALNLTKHFYAIFLAALLFVSFTMRIRNDLGAQNWILALIDTLIGVPTLIYWWSYTQVSNELDHNGSKRSS